MPLVPSQLLYDLFFHLQLPPTFPLQLSPAWSTISCKETATIVVNTISNLLTHQFFKTLFSKIFNRLNVQTESKYLNNCFRKIANNGSSFHSNSGPYSTGLLLLLLQITPQHKTTIIYHLEGGKYYITLKQTLNWITLQ